MTRRVAPEMTPCLCSGLFEACIWLGLLTISTSRCPSIETAEADIVFRGLRRRVRQRSLAELSVVEGQKTGFLEMGKGRSQFVAVGGG